MTTDSFVYFMKPCGMDGPIKIGFSYSPRGRLEVLSVWSPFPLEIIGAVPGVYDDEQFLHRCFAQSHHHREWFHSTPSLRETIDEIIAAGSVEAVRGKISPVGTIRGKVGIHRSAEMKRWQSYYMKVGWAEKRLRKRGEDTNWCVPDDVRAILRKWRIDPVGKDIRPPLQSELDRLDEYLEDPAAHSVTPYVKFKNTRTAA